MIYFNLILSVFIMVGMIAIFPTMSYSTVIDSKYQRSTFWKYFFSGAMAITTGMFVFIPWIVHGVIDKIAGGVLWVFSIRYTPFVDTPIAGDIIILYTLLGIAINLIVVTLFYSSIKNNQKS